MTTTSPSSGSGCTRSAGSGTSPRIEMGADAIAPRARRRRRAVEGHPVRVRRQLGGRQARPARRAARPHRHPVHQCVQRAAPPAASAVQQAANAIRLGDADIGIAVGMDKHPRARSRPTPPSTRCPSWYGENGQFVTTKFFGMKINRYMHDHGISRETLAKVAAKNFRNGALNPNAFRRKPIAEEDILDSPMLNYPLTQYMFCAPDEGAAAVVLCRADIAHRYTDTPVYLRAVEMRTRDYGAYEVNTHRAPPSTRTSHPPSYASKAAFEKAGIGPGGRRRDPVAGHRRRRRDHPHGRERLLRRRRSGEAASPTAPPRSTAPLPVNTDGGLIANGEPIGASGLRQIHELVPPAPRRGGRSAGARRAEGRLRPALRRARHGGGDDPDDLICASRRKSPRHADILGTLRLLAIRKGPTTYVSVERRRGSRRCRRTVPVRHAQIPLRLARRRTV